MAIEHTNPPGMNPPPPGMYTHVVKAGPSVYISGQLAFDATGNLVGGSDVAAQYRQVWANVTTALASAGATVDDIVRTTTYIVGQGNVQAVRSVRQEVNPQPPPASTLITVVGLANPACLVEVDAIAVILEEDRTA
jgi:enamine deaminase RidA (YjgF/YER057c/UK114 family)